MKNIIIFRTDRIGDLLLSLPFIYTLKEIYKDSKITLVSSKNNSKIANNLSIFDNVIVFPNKYLLTKILFIYAFSKSHYDLVINLDGKNRSIFSTIFVNSTLKATKTSKKFHEFICKFFKIDFFPDSINTNLNDIHQKFLKFLNIDKKISNYDYLKTENLTSAFNNFEINDYIHLHLDEKWFYKDYIKSYTYIEPSFEELLNFLNDLSKINNIVVTTGLNNNNIYNELINKHCTKINDKKFIFNKNTKIFFILNPFFNELITISSKSKTLITCHGAMTHVANCFNVKIIDIIEQQKEKFDSRCTSYIKNYIPVYRSVFKILQKNLIDKI